VLGDRWLVSGDDWTAPGVYEVAADVFRVPLPLPTDGLRAVNIYVIVDAGRLVCIDSGWAVPDARAVLDAALTSLGCSVADIDRFLVTHAHRDHYTMAVSLRRSEGMAVSLGAGERPSLEAIADPDRSPLDERLSALRGYGAGHLVEVASGPWCKRATGVGSLETSKSTKEDLHPWHYEYRPPRPSVHRSTSCSPAAAT
jgi:hypothetical protein